MANIAPTFFGSGLAAFGVSINVVGAALNGTAAVVTGDWVTPVNDLIIDGVAISYIEGTGTDATAVSIAFQVQIGTDATAYNLRNTAGAAYALAPAGGAGVAGADAWFVPLVSNAPTAGAVIIPSGAVTAIRAISTVTGTAAGTDALKVTFCGSRRR